MGTVIYETRDEQPIASGEDFAYEGGSDAVALGPLLRQLLAIARRNLWFIAAIIFSFVVAAAIITILTTPKYTAHSSIEISDQSDQVLGQQFDDNQQQVGNWDVDRFLNSQVTILKSRSLADRVAQKLNLYTSAEFFDAMQADQDSFENQTELHDGVAQLLSDNLAISLPDDSRVATIEFTSTDPQMSAKIANAFASEFIQSNLQRKFDSSSYARDFVQQQLNEARARLEQSENDLNAYARSAGLIRARDPNSTSTDGTSGSATAANSVTTSSLLQVNQAANDAQAKLIVAQARWNAERAQPLLSSPAALASPVVQQLLQRRSELQAQLDTARDRYLDNHPTIINLESQLKNTNDQLTRAANEARDAVRTDLVAAQTAAQQLQAQVHALEGATLQEQDRSVRYNTLAREADTNRSIYDGLLQRFRELNASAGITASNVSVIDEADAPAEPSSPHPMLNLAIALVLGTVAAAVVVFLKDQLDDRIRIPEEVEEKVGLSLLGVIPEAKDEDPIEALNDPKSVVSESYSALRSSLLYSTREGLPGLVLVTSAQPSEGKSTTSYAVARSMAQVGKRALLVDGDLRRPSIHRLAAIENKVGLSSVLVGEKTIPEAISRTTTDNLFVMPSGPLPPSPAELLSSPRLVEFLNAVRDQFDVIIVDSAPVLGLADSPGLSALADGVLLVIEANRGRGGQLKAAVRRLRMMKPTILGAVLTKFDPEGAGNAYSTYYQYDSYQYRSEAAE